MTHQTDIDVLIVGAGPTGLTMACLLAQFGVKFKIIEKHSGITTRSKALGVQARTLELFKQLEISDKAVAQGYPAIGLDLVIQGKLKAHLELKDFGNDLTEFPYMLILEQCKTEQILLEKLQSLGEDVYWDRELLDIQHHPNSVTATFSYHERMEVINAKYIVAADGAHSTVRTLLHMPFEGGTYESRFMLADIAMEGPISREHITLCLSRKGFTGFFPMVGADRFRAIGLLPDNVPANADKEFEMMSAEIKRQAQMDLKISDPHWISTYKIHHRTVLKFKEQRCFFAGDAAHVHSPAGAQGMNTGIQDVFNLAWKLHFVLTGHATARLLDTYHAERFPIARKLIQTTDRAFGFITHKNSFLQELRLFLLPTVLKFLLKTRSFRTFVFRTVSQIGIRYRKSPLSEQRFLSEAEFKAGDRCWQSPHDGYFHAFIVGKPQEQEQMTEVLEKYLETRVHIQTLHKRIDITSILQCFGVSKDGIVLVRPDGYTAYCAEGLDVKSLERYLKRFFVPTDFKLQKGFEEKEGFPFETFI